LGIAAPPLPDAILFGSLALQKTDMVVLELKQIFRQTTAGLSNC
jgi:hypothetical protein